MKPTKNIIAISGSLRAGSSNHGILRFLGKLAPANVNYAIYDGLSQLPHFDPGLDHDDPPETVTALRKLLTEADGVVICTPEYAFGVPGSLKNALDWMVSSGSLVGKPLALITASTGGKNAHASLLLTLGALSANVLEDATLLISFIRSKMDGDGNITDVETANKLKTAFTALLNQL
ncbi:NADPH-dependent FMN reductase [Mucilaginibacter gotjawali]|uniref:NAD(P)H-dependent FMN reductase n=2 Tax=Mucilaginibacter gotjawali TaxID=1550579 RepID=A0A839SGK9_9SPHI|nr:NADPH-dependent FMN reductase [Mucilaginibacter gotjawali]MBB3055667.1 NAD(P)H-dependent FMN reductase [Mucilaginibacter gotjawali]BAU54486.1 NADPH azoreductase [Mucilaginibacter gotjawali]